jgi:3-carboxy-cis,cis-muconate cycloisomerase
LVGSLAALGDRGIDVMGDVARQLGLAEPVTPWHTIRLRPARLAAALGSALGVMGKIARDVTLLSQNEVGEVSEGGTGRGGSTTMPQKRNPIGAVAILACAERGPGLVATIMAAMVQEHERASGAWQAEAETLSELLRLTLSAADCLRELVAELEVDPERMRENLDAAGTPLMTESLADALTRHLGRGPAGKLVAEAVRRAAGERRPLADVLLELTAVREALGEEGLARALDPERYLGVSERLIDRALLAHGLASEP